MDLSWDGVPGKLNRYRIKGAISDFSSAAVGEIPGISGFSATIDGDEEGGQIRLDSRQLTFDAPAALREPVTLDTLTGPLRWQPKGKEWQLSFDNIAFANADAAGTFYGNYETRAGTPGVIDLNLALTRGEVRSAARYTPFIALAPKDNEWLAGALQAGQTSDFRLRVKGNLDDFPLKENSTAILELGGHARGVVLEFDKNWPKIENIDGEFWIRGRRMELNSERAAVMGGEIRKVTAEVSDLTAAEMSLAISGEVIAPSERFLDFIQKSPLRDYINRFTDGMHARGDGALKLSMQIPLLGAQPFRLNGEFSADKNDLDFGKGIPLMRNTRGKLLFTERSAQADSVTTEILGGNAVLSFKSDAAGLQVAAQGRADFDAMRRREPSWLLNRLYGNTRWDASFRMNETTRRLKITSDLSGVRSTLPGVFGKTAQSKMPLLIEMPDSANGQESIQVRLDKLGAAEIRPQGQGWKMLATFKNPTLTGTIEKKLEGQGGWRANLDSLNWPEEPDSTGMTSTTSETLAPSELPAMEIQIDQLTWAGKQLGRLIFVGVPENGGWRLGRLAIENPDGALSGKGFWKGAADASETQLTLKLNISNAGKILARSGYPDTVKDGSGQLDAELRWNGAPNAFNYATLDGELKLDTGKGQFLKMKPGIGKLLGILSLQSIPKRITLDFNDVFSDGFQFDSIRGNAKIDNGVMRTDDLRLEGSSAKVTMKGSVDLNRETQNLRVKILPTVGDSVSLIGAFAAGPAIGVGALLVNKVLGEPLDKLVSFEYNVSGTWSDPIVAKVGQGTANPSANKPE